MATLNLTSGYRTAVWRVIAAALQADPVYASAELQLQFFDGSGETIADLDTYPSGAVQFFPACGQMAWFDERSQSGALVVQTEARLRSLDVEDIFNLQEALETTLATVDTAGLGLQQALVTAGALTGLILFSQPLRPAAGPPGADGLFRLTGQFVVEVLRIL